MLKNAVLFAAAACLLAVFGPSLLSQLTPAPSTPEKALAVAASPPPASEPAAQTAATNFGEVSIPSDGRGQFAADVMLNGNPTHMLVDTGATVVSISAATAAGIRRHARARTEMDRADRQRQVERDADDAARPELRRHLHERRRGANSVAPEAGEVNLLGASFLKRLASVEQRNGLLVLRQ